MAYDADAFVTEYLAGRVGQAVGELRISAVRSDRLRRAIDVVLSDDAGRELIVFLERRVEGAACLTQTSRFNLSYYPSRSVPDAEAAALGRAFGAWLCEREAALSDAAAERAFNLDPHAPERAVELRINRECNEACVFCNTPEDSDTILPGPQAVFDALGRERAAGHRAVLFTGREPTLDARLVDYVARARSLGYERIRLQTNGTRLGDATYLALLIDAGITEVEISLHTRDGETFEQLIGKRSLLNRTWAGIERVLDAGLRLHLVLVVTTANLDEAPRLLASLGRDLGGRLKHVTLSPMAPVGDGARHVDLVPRLASLTATLPAIARAADDAGIALDIPSRCGLPLCAIPDQLRRFSAELENRPGLTLEPGKRKAPACATCRFDAVCTGVWDAYLDRHGNAELVPVRAGVGSAQ